VTINQIIKALLASNLTAGQRKDLNLRVRNFRQRRPGGGRLHHPSHYVPEILSLARKHGVIDETTKISTIR